LAIKKVAKKGLMDSFGGVLYKCIGIIKICIVILEMIQLKDALKEMETPDSSGMARLFDLKVISWDFQRGKGGELLEFNQVSLTDVKHSVFGEAKININAREKPTTVTIYKDPNHKENKTKNVRLRNGQIRKVHIRFMTEYNGKQIMY
jgi:hypothetical protein